MNMTTAHPKNTPVVKCGANVQKIQKLILNYFFY